LEADQGGQFERPEAGSLAEVARGLVQQGAEVFIALFGPGGVGGLGGLGLRAQAGRPLGGEGPQGVADGLRGAAQGGGDPGGPLAPVAGEEDLAAAQGEGVARAQPLAQRGPFGDRKSADEQWWFHASFYAPDAVTNPVLWKCTSPPRGGARRASETLLPQGRVQPGFVLPPPVGKLRPQLGSRRGRLRPSPSGGRPASDNGRRL